MTADATGKAYMWARGMLKHRISIANSLVSQKELEEMFFNYYPTVKEAIEDSLKIYGEDATFIVIPYASDIFVVAEDEVKSDN